MENKTETYARRPADELAALLRSLPQPQQDELAASLLAQAKAARAAMENENETDQSDEKPSLLSFLLSMRDELEDVEFERIQSPARDIDFTDI